jgi:peroxiredoxin
MRTACFGTPGVFFLAIALSVGTLGCGSGDNASQSSANSSAETAGLPTTAIPNAPNDARAKPPEKDTPEWYIHEMAQIRLQSPPETGDINAIRDFQREQNYKIRDLAKHAIAKTHEDPGKTQLFETAVHHGMEAQLQLAIQVNGVSPEEHQQNVEELFQNAQLLYKYAPESKAANEAGFTLVNFAEIMARKMADEDPTLIEEYASVARLFALTFPKDEARAIAKLDAAGWCCEAYGKLDEAIACYSQIETQFPSNALAQHVPAVLRRLQLKGQELQLAGPTQDGKFLSIDTLRNKVVLVAFWAADTDDFDRDAGILKNIYGKYAAAGLEIVGVNLDDNEAQMQAFLKQHGFTWPNIFYIDQAKRRWNNPLVRYYGIREIPTYWLVNQQGVVVDIHVNLEKADAQIQQLLGN